MAEITVTLNGTITVTTERDALVDLLQQVRLAGLVTAPAPAAPPQDNTDSTGAGTAESAEEETLSEPDFPAVDQSPQAIAEAEQTAFFTGWTLDLALSWCDELDYTLNGRMLHEVPAASGGYATATAMRTAAGRPVDGSYGLSGFTGGVSKRFKRWSARTSGAEKLSMPVETDYDLTVTSRQRARGFRIAAELLPLFQIALAQTRS